MRDLGKLAVIVLLISFSTFATASMVELDFGPDSDYTLYNQTETYTSPDTGLEVPVNGTFYLEVNITEVDSGQDRVELLRSGINESEYDERITGNGGTSHIVKGLGPNGSTFYESGFKLYSRAVEMRMGANGSRKAVHDVERYPKHLFRIPADYRIKELVIKEGNKTIFNISVPERVCVGENPPHYCKWNNYTETSDNGNITGVFEPQDKESVSLGFWEKIIALLSGWIQNVI